MKVLLIAYEYPPVLAPQSLRWHYLGNELARLGVEVDVLTASLRDIWGFDDHPHPGVRVHRCFPGPFVGLSGRLAGALKPRSGAASADDPSGPGRIAERAYRGARSVLNHVVFPDVRTEWFPFAWRAAKRLHAARKYDLVISSHEPGVDLLLGLKAKRQWGIPWVADLGDPLLTPYTPRWRARLDRALEARVCREADAILVTNEVVAGLLSDRHGTSSDSFTVVRQGFDMAPDGTDQSQPDPIVEDGRLVLLFTGTFYRKFRDPTPLISALSEVPEVHLVVAGDVGPFGPAFDVLGDRATLLGKRPHSACLALQRRADALVNLGNTQSYQVPGKIYEYLGAGRPILHIAGSADDPAAALLEEIRRGISVPNEWEAIASALGRLHGLWRDGQLDEVFDLSMGPLEQFTWAAGARRLHDRLTKLVVGR